MNVSFIITILYLWEMLQVFFFNTFMEITIFEQIIMILIIKLFNLYIISTFLFFPKILFYYQIILYLYTIPNCELLHSIYVYI